MKKAKAIYGFEKAVAQTIDRHGLLRQNDRVLLGLSGGADSVSLLFSLCALTDVYDLSIAACHVNHHIRKGSAERDEEFCRTLCKRLKIPFYSQNVDVPLLCRTEKGSTEEIARKARYACLHKVCAENGFTKIATAHTLSDNAETVFFNLIKGCSPDGLSGIPFCRGNIIRPLRERTRDEVEAYLAALDEEFVTDETNFSLEYDRNYIRHTLLPSAKRLNPALEQALGRLSAAATEDKRYFEERLCAVDRSLESTSDMPDVGDALSVELLSVLSVPLAKRYLLSYCKARIQSRLSQKHIDALYALVNAHKAERTDCSYVDLPAYRATVQDGYLRLFPCDGKQSTADNTEPFAGDFNISLKSGYTVVNPSFLVHVAYSEKIPSASAGEATSAASAFPNVLKFENNVYKLYEKIDCRCDIIVGSLYARSRKAEDRLAIGGMHRLLKKVYSEHRIPIDLRSQIPVVCDANGILCVPFFRVPRDGAAPKPTDARTLSIAFYTAQNSEFCKE